MARIRSPHCDEIEYRFFHTQIYVYNKKLAISQKKKLHAYSQHSSRGCRYIDCYKAWHIIRRFAQFTEMYKCIKFFFHLFSNHNDEKNIEINLYESSKFSKP